MPRVRYVPEQSRVSSPHLHLPDHVDRYWMSLSNNSTEVFRRWQDHEKLRQLAYGCAKLLILVFR